MRYRWKAECQIKNGFMQEDRSKRTVEVLAGSQSEAEKEAQLRTCTSLGLSTMMHKYVSVLTITNIGRA